ncbi:MAG: bifunctional DNA-formamidopyrimidine glycosylase/DNA-(apurinic or apyrimidinic site) lyase [Planctomycetes bacterium]|nr:bifunctional DNA-formamidopyrimidine glycosylase/DNA-(apurinic or apyrimidinic site) lyase [Planctomycetota bacterium]
MPELPEVETVVRDLRPHLTGRRLSVARVGDKALRRPWRREWEQPLRGRVIEQVRRRGKWIVLDLVGEAHLVFHLGMTGQLTVADAAEPLRDHTHLVFDLAEPKRGRSARQLRFRDIRRFGSATLFPTTAALQRFFVASGLGPEPFDLAEPWWARYWQKRVRRSKRCLKAILLDQTVVAGVGNIYADEALFEAKLHPGRSGSSLAPVAARRLRQGVVTVLERAIAKRGSTIRDYVGGEGLRGGYQEEFRVYGRTGKPCVRCRTALARTRLAGRSTHYCPKCQRRKDEG